MALHPVNGDAKQDFLTPEREQAVGLITDASADGDLAKVKWLIDLWRSASSMLDPTAEDLQRALTCAARYSHDTIVAYLLDQGAEIDHYATTFTTSGASAAVWASVLKPWVGYQLQMCYWRPCFYCAVPHKSCELTPDWTIKG